MLNRLGMSDNTIKSTEETWEIHENVNQEIWEIPAGKIREYKPASLLTSAERSCFWRVLSVNRRVPRPTEITIRLRSAYTGTVRYQRENTCKNISIYRTVVQVARHSVDKVPVSSEKEKPTFSTIALPSSVLGSMRGWAKRILNRKCIT